MGEQDYELWTVTFPYMSPGDLLNFDFDSKNIPAPNRTNWKDAQTDERLQLRPLGADRGGPREILRLVHRRVIEQHRGRR